MCNFILNFKRPALKVKIITTLNEGVKYYVKFKLKFV